jgi:hypothetical protein
LQLRFDTAAMREQAMQFYVMHNLSLPPARAPLREAFIALWKACHASDGDAVAVVAHMKALAALPGLAALVEHWSGNPDAATRQTLNLIPEA